MITAHSVERNLNLPVVVSTSVTDNTMDNVKTITHMQRVRGNLKYAKQQTSITKKTQLFPMNK